MTDQSTDNPTDLSLLDPVEARVLGCLMEKQRTTPDAYPLTLNTLVVACNQKTSRNPVMSLGTGEVGHTVNRLRDRDLIHASFAGRAERYDHKMASAYHLDRRAQALICSLMLRGPQTIGELRTNTDATMRPCAQVALDWVDQFPNSEFSIPESTKDKEAFGTGKKMDEENIQQFGAGTIFNPASAGM